MNLGNSQMGSVVQRGKSQQHKNKVDATEKQKSNNRPESKIVGWIC